MMMLRSAKFNFWNKFQTRQNHSVPQHLLNIPATKQSALKNGFRVASEEGPSDTATVGVFIDAGSSYETDEDNGVAHFLEHLAFKGTQRRTQKALELEIENMGGHLNAYTSREQTVYYARVFKKDVPRAVDILADIIQNSTLSPEAIERERSTIIREAQEVEANVEETLFDHLHATAFQGTGLGRTILGPEKNINSLKREDLIKYIETHYTAPRMVLAAAGGVKHEELTQLAEKHFGNLRHTSAHKMPSLQTRYTGSMVSIPDFDLPLVHFIIGFKSIPWNHPNYWVMSVIQSLLGNWDITAGGGKSLSSRLCEIASAEGKAHSISTFHTPYSRTGLFGVYATCTPQSLTDTPGFILSEMVRISKAVSEEEVARAKKRVFTSVLSQLDATHQVAEDIGRQILTIGKRQSLAEVYARISAIDAAAVRSVADELFYDQCPVVACQGPYESFLPDYNHLRTWTTWKSF